MDQAPPTTHRITEFHRWHKEGRLILRPPFQRKPVWSRRTQSYLIDTLLRGLPVPEIYIQVKTDRQGNTTYEVVDGQQRLRAILEFIEGEYEILEDESPEFSNKEFQNLSDGDTHDFWDYPLVVRELRTNSEQDVREIFKRLNKNVVPLNPQELRHAAYSGEFIKLVESLADDEYWADNKIVGPSDIRRMRDVEFVSELLVGIMVGPQHRTETLDDYYKIYDTSFPERDKWQKHFRKTQSTIEETLSNFRGTQWNQRADFYALFIAVSDLLKNHLFPSENYEKIKNELIEFRRQVNLEKDQSKDRTRSEYYSTIGFGGVANKEHRTKRITIVKNMLLQHVIPRDAQRDFTEEQRQLAWDMSADKLCAICSKKVEWNDYHLDHEIPYSKGGRTELSNSQITHKKCNITKQAK